MKNILILGLVAGLLFSVSAGLSIFLNSGKPPEEQDADKSHGKKSSGKDHDTSHSSTKHHDPLKTEVRPPASADAGDTLKLSENLRTESAQLKSRMLELDQREFRLQFVIDDMAREREVLEKLTKDLGKEMAYVSQRNSLAEDKLTKVAEKENNLIKKQNDLVKTQDKIDLDERKGIEHLASVYEAMAPDKAASILKTMADSGRMTTSVKILAKMSQAKSSKVLTAIEELDPGLAADLTVRILSVNRTPTPVPAN